MRQAISTASESLDKIDELADQWKGGRFPLLNKGSLALAKSGAMGKSAQGIATQLEAQITDVTSELGNVYMGGNSPTDQALGLAAKNLSADWSNDTLRKMTDLARTNLKFRKNAIESTGAITSTPPSDKAPASASKFKVGDTVTVNGKTVKIAKIYPDGTFDPEK
jgi:hypothetical protein